MATLIVKVTPTCEGLLHNLPQHEGFEIDSEEYTDDGSGTITVLFDGDDLSATAEQMLNANDDVISYWIE